MKKPSALIIFLTVFIDLIGFGIVLPLIPLFSDGFGANGFLVGVIMASFSAMQFLFAPLWGRMSDRIGRRPVILIGLCGSTISYAIFAIACGLQGESKELALWVILGSRMLAGVMGANVSVAQAYMADVSPPEKRSKSMGLIGMAFGLGFVFGPFIGALGLAQFGMTGPGWVATGFCGFAFLFAVMKLQESRKPDSDAAPQRPHFQQIKKVLGTPQVGLLIGLFFLATFCFTTFETTLGLLVQNNFGLDKENPQDAKTIGYLFGFAGLVGAMVQGGMIGRLVKKYGEPKLIVMSLVLTGISLAPLPFAKTWTWLLIALGGLAIGSSLTRPPIFGMISMLSPKDEQGATIGVAQSAGSFARIFGPIFAGTCFELRQELPYLICGAVAVLAALIAVAKLGGAGPAVDAPTGTDSRKPSEA
ncbi:MAG: MFS transporter [Verrucomicrobiales bacterium]|nr:MFS transporter [Verrucomicrobiales bacterium]|tara:strand:- start:636 stop:1889 length:1254 start_codon:yes stop_codon:yes gene_type:complete